MGLAFTKLFARLFSKKEMRILMASAPAHAPLTAVVCKGHFVEAAKILRTDWQFVAEKASTPVDRPALRW